MFILHEHFRIIMESGWWRCGDGIALVILTCLPVTQNRKACLSNAPPTNLARLLLLLLLLTVERELL